MIKKIILLASAAVIAVVAIINFDLLKKWIAPSDIVLEPTGITIKEISGIGKLICAEYVGEVVDSFTEHKEKILKSYKSGEKIKALYLFLKDAADRKIIKKEDLENDTWKYKLNNTDDILFVDKPLMEMVFNMKDTDFVEPYKTRVDQEINRVEPFAYLARGIVRMSYDLSKLNEKNIFFHASSGTLLLHLKLEVEPTINPWFIYSRKVKIEGYEVLEDNLDVEHEVSFYCICRVKKGCIEKLKNQVESGKEIKETARSSAHQTLTRFFSLFTFNGMPIKEARIIENQNEFNQAKMK